MEGEEDIAAALPRPPFPAPARREAAIAEAMHRFDGGGTEAPAVGPGARPAFRRPGVGRPYAGALAGALLVAVVGLPFVWPSFDRYVAEEGGTPPPKVEAPASRAPAADAQADVDLMDPPGPAEAEPPSPGAAPERPSIQPVAPASPQPAARLDEAGPGGPALPDAATADSSDEITVTGSRIRNPNLSSSSPVTTVGNEEITLTGSRARRADWNACTIDDPKRDLRACRRAVNPVARGSAGRAAAQVGAGLERAWAGETEEAVDAFDRAIEASPGSAAAYLNRGLARQRLGDLDGALADLDRAARIEPRSARIHFHRSRVLRERGDERRARAAEDRAVELDPAYADPVRAQRRRKR